METRILVECTEIDDSKSLVFFCPGCNYNHSFRIEAGSQPEKPVWEWNGDMCKPTFSPSLLVNGSTEQRCHLYVVSGQIQYLSDCWHNMRGQTVDMPEIDW